MKNKQVKQMMVSALSYQSDICNIFWDESVLWFDDSGADCEYVYQPLLPTVSISASSTVLLNPCKFKNL